jgi:hypothetical protein
MSNIEFLVYDVVAEPGGGWLVSGIVNNGAVLKGCTFVRARARSSEETAVNLTVSKIVSYRHEFDELPKGLSGGLYVVGEGAGRLRRNDMLESQV